MINIKSKLKELGIKLADFSEALQISRPTLDSYINLYESGEGIPKEEYQKTFDSLFKEDIHNEEVFRKILNEYSNMIKQEKRLETSNLERDKTNILTSLVEQMKKDMLSSEYDEDIYIFINMLIRSYKKEIIFKKLAKYFVILNGRRKIENPSKEDKLYLSNYYELFLNDKNNSLVYKEEYWNKFLKRIDELKKIEKKHKSEFEKKLIDKVNLEVQVLLDSGIDFQDIDINQILKNIKLD